jgi:hypothetical protein
MAKLIKVRFHQFGGNDVLRVDRLEQSGPDAGQSWFPFGGKRQSGRLQDEVRALIGKLRKDKQPVA